MRIITMEDHRFLEMWDRTREYIIASHQFYVDQAKSRLLSQFDNMEEEAEKYAEEWLEENIYYIFDPDEDDPDDFNDQANEASEDFHQNLYDLNNQARFAITAGMYHKWDKELREWIIQESRHSSLGIYMKENIWNVHLKGIMDLFQGCGWDIKNENFYKLIDACRLVVNVYKHGNGNSLDDLKKYYPEYIFNPLSNEEFKFNFGYLDHSDLILTDDNFQTFSDAIVTFWQSVPNKIYCSENTTFPNWLNEAIKKKQKEAAK